MCQVVELSGGVQRITVPTFCSGGAGAPCLPCTGGEAGGGLGRPPRGAETDGRRHQPLH